MSWLVPCDYLGRRIEGWGSNDVVKMTMKNKLQSKEILEKHSDENKTDGMGVE